jgi:hypothetical protein
MDEKNFAAFKCNESARLLKHSQPGARAHGCGPWLAIKVSCEA